MAQHFIFQHLDTARSYVTILFVDCSSAFNTVIPALPQGKLSLPKVLHSAACGSQTSRRTGSSMCGWGSISLTPESSAPDPPQGCVLCLFLKETRRKLAHLVTWCRQKNLELNALKTVEMIINFWKYTASPIPITV
ncbi:unnamed protein product [Menidia menidia]|uniref:(Atlantic silverside) hypothetical protein n=1 Tax=Menidia menidia TaxID=238744 RepID=A0A8S4B2B0_9TELE|nr:unnamed protein product [Menidia menidia]